MFVLMTRSELTKPDRKSTSQLHIQKEYVHTFVAVSDFFIVEE